MSTAQEPESEVKLYVGNLSYDTTEDRLREVFQRFGTITDVFCPIGTFAAKREGVLDGSVMIYKVRGFPYYNATGTTGDQRYA